MMNTLANHGYLPHNGVATIAQFIDATYKGFGMATDLATFLATFGAVVDGTLTQWSIEGKYTSSFVLNTTDPHRRPSHRYLRLAWQL